MTLKYSVLQHHSLFLLPYCIWIESIEDSIFLAQLRKWFTNSNKRLHIKWTDASFLCNRLQITSLSFTLKPPQLPFLSPELTPSTSYFLSLSTRFICKTLSSIQSYLNVLYVLMCAKICWTCNMAWTNWFTSPRLLSRLQWSPCY